MDERRSFVKHHPIQPNYGQHKYIMEKKTMFNDKRKYIFAVAILILIAFCWYFYFAFNHVENLLLHEKIIDRQFDTDLMCTQIDLFVDKSNDWGIYDYTSILSFIVSYMDAISGRSSYAELFNADFDSLSERSVFFTGAPFDLKEHPELIEEIRANETGNITVLFDKEGIPPHELYLYYRWIPTDSMVENRLLIITGVSKYSVNTDIGVEIIFGAVALIIVSAIFIISTVILLCQLGYIRTLRKGTNKWRSKISSSQ